uniref:hypothetical protein n=1 Tax=Nocardia suismassiliense TaxID=2077092 RepID=UPI003F4988C8
MTCTVIAGPAYIQADYGPGGGGPAQPCAWAWGFAWDTATGEVIRDRDGINAVAWWASASLSAADATGTALRDRLRDSIIAQLIESGHANAGDTVQFSWVDRDLVR